MHVRRTLRFQSLLTFAHDVMFMLHVQMQGVHITLRMRLFCEVFRDGKPMKGQQYEVLNEVVVDRGANPYLTKIECYEQGRLITKVRQQSTEAMTRCILGKHFLDSNAYLTVLIWLTSQSCESDLPCFVNHI